MEFRSVADLSKIVTSSLDKIPHDVQVVIGVPRSGLMVASLIAFAKHLPMADVVGFAEGRLIASGRTRRAKSLELKPGEVRRALVVDDSIASGDSIREARELLERSCPNVEFTYCAVYSEGWEVGFPIIYFEKLPQPRIFEWNFMNHSILEDACVDIDGVLCFDPTDSENDDGDRYVKFLLEARPLYCPRKPIGTLVTSRLEKYREHTERWLTNQGIIYRELVMLDLPDMATRRALGNHGDFKGSYYKNSRARIFIESELHQAHRIAEISGKPVLCTAGPMLVMPNSGSLRGALYGGRSSVRRIARTLLIGGLGRANFQKVRAVVKRLRGGK